MEIIEYIKKVILDYHTEDIEELTSRDYQISLIKDMSFSITGPRRSGKSYNHRFNI